MKLVSSNNSHMEVTKSFQWRIQEFCSGGGGVNKFSWEQRTETTGIWGL